MKFRSLLNFYQQGTKQTAADRRGAAGKRWLIVEELESRTMPAAGLVAAYNFDQGGSSVLTDVSGNGNNGTISNASWVSTGKFGGALSFKGSLNSFVRVPDSASLHLTAGMTLEAWVKATTLNSLTGWATPLAKENHASTANDNTYALYASTGAGTKPSGHVLVGGADYAASGSSMLPLNQWTFLATTYDGATLRMYVNGNLVGSKAVSGSIAITKDPLRIGGNWSGDMFTGLVDNVRIYNTALSQSAIKGDMATPVASQTNAIAPTVSSVTPANGASQVALSAAVQVTFTGAIDPATANATTVQLLGPGGLPVSAAVSFTASTNTAALTPSSPLAGGTWYTVLVRGGTSGAAVKDVNGNPLAANFTSAFTTAAPAPNQPFPNNLTPPPLPAPTGAVVHVSTAAQLQSAVANLRSGQTILIDPGTYNVTDTLWLPQGVSNVAIRGTSGKASDVVIQGAGMSGPIGFGFWTGNVQNVTFADFTIRDFAEHAFIFNAGTQSPLIHNVTMIDVGEQFVKSNPDGSGGGVNNGVVEYSTMKYTTNAPSYYTNGVDVHTGSNWIIRDNVFQNIRAVGDLAGPAILIWNHSQNATVEGNTFLNNQRDISFGLDPNTLNDNIGGIIRNNFIFRSGPQGGDVGIYLGNSPGTEVANNTVVLNGDYPNAIEYRWANTSGVTILYNLTDSAITSREGATAVLAGNVTNAQPSWFVGPTTGDLHLTAAATGAIGQAQFLPEVSTDYDGQPRSAAATDVGADQYQAVSTQPLNVSVTSPTLGSTVSGTVTAAATVSNSAGAVSVQFYVDGTALGAADTAAPYTASLDTTQLANGAHTLTAQARDVVGNSATSAAVSFTVLNVTQPPTVAVTGPTPGSMVSGTITVTASASSSVGVASVQFYLDGAALGAADTAAPYTASLDTTQLANGAHTLTAQARDVVGNSATSAAVSFTVANGNPPAVAAVAPANGTTNVTTSPTIIVTFTGTIDPNTVNASTVQLVGPNGAVVSAAVSFNASTDTATLTPGSALGTNSTYTVLVHGGSSGAVVKDTAGRPLATNFTSSFTTINPTPAPVANAGPNQTGNEGSAITFSGSVSNGSAPFTYSWTFGDGATASGTLTPSHVYADNGTYTATLTVTDGQGRTSRSSATATVVNVAPTANAGGPYSGVAGSAVTFTGSATDPGPNDTFTYRWSFGDGGTATTATASHAYAAGTYTATLTVTDKDGATGTSSTTVTVTATGVTPNSDPYIVTPYLKIPNFGAHPTVVSVKSGNWSDPTVWSLSRLPTAGDIVDINPGTTVTYDVNDSAGAAALNTLEIQPTAKLTFRTDITTGLYVVNFVVLQGGELDIGTQANPIAANVMAQVVFANQPLNTTLDPEQYGNGLIGLGTINMYGAAKAAYVTLSREAHAGDTVLHLAAPATGWQVGDRLFVPDTQQLPYYPGGFTYTPEWEQPTIQSISADGLTITLSSALRYDHLGAHDANGVLNYLPQVANLTRNVSIHSQSATGTRGYALFTGRANVNIEYASFGGMGRTNNSGLNNLVNGIDGNFDNTTFDANGAVTHVGTNEANRNAITFLNLFGPTAPQANGYQYTFVGNTVTCPLTPMPFIWGINVQNSYYGLIQNNDLVNWYGAGINVDATSSYNRFNGNFVMNITGDTQRLDQGLQGDGYWFGNPNNYITNNIATDINGAAYNDISGDFFSFGFDIDAGTGVNAAGIGTVSIAAYQGADPSVPGQSRQINMNDTPLLEFSGNQVYGATPCGLTLWLIGTYGDDYYTDAQVSMVKNFLAWNYYAFGIYLYPNNNVTFDGLVIRGDASTLDNPYQYSQGIAAVDYMTHNLVVQNADIQGEAVGIGVPFMNGRVPAMNTTVIKNSFLDNTVNIRIQPPQSANGGTDFSPSTVDIVNVKFAQPRTIPQSGASVEMFNIQMLYVGPGTFLDGAYEGAPQYVYVTNYNGIVGDNFQVFYDQGPSPTDAPAGSGIIPTGVTRRQLIGGYVRAVRNITVTPSTPLAATVNSAYSGPVSATGGSGVYTYRVTSGSLPPGLTLDASTGVVSGTPTAIGIFTFTIMVTDNNIDGLSGSLVESLSVVL
jgi:chitodextrinase